MARTLLPLLALFQATLLLAVTTQTTCVRAGDDRSPAEPLVARALRAESLGRQGERQKLLEQALSLDPDSSPARWSSGFVKRDGQWLTIEQAQEQAANDGRLHQYWRQANAATLKVKDQLRLARWCDEQGLQDLAKMHWYRVHLKQPKHKEAAKQLGLEEYENRYLWPEQIAAAKAHEEAAKYWKPRLKSWNRAIQEGADNRDEALSELRNVVDLTAIPFLLHEFADDAELAEELVAILGGMSPMATYGWLCRFAVEHEDQKVRACATQQLISQLGREPRIQQGLLPMLLGQLQVPAELRYYVSSMHMISFTVDTYGPGANYQMSVLAGRPFSEVLIVNPRRSPKPLPIYSPRPEVYAHLANAERAVRNQNETVQRRNSRLFDTLRSVTKKTLPDDPQRWWDWWLEENERYLNIDKPTYYKDLTVDRPRDVRVVYSTSCFVAGTPVWTETGPRPIERVQVGERVLSQDSESGELGYRFVCKTTLRPPSKTLRLRVGNDEVWSTLGHLFWVSGKGWKMAKQLRVGDLIHSVDGAYPITAVENGPTVEAYNLVVDQFNTYFVGERPLLVHDNMPHRLTPTVVPGLVDATYSEVAAKK